ncbi:MAG: uroporphyrinogen-III C-methyltransferase [Gammaproteobacteria bacterium]|nr:uroporphyrinogen-III C-methyltransferase [Gammaproteobacteria bacterium]
MKNSKTENQGGSSVADKPETPKILDEISKGTNTKSGVTSSRSKKNARRRFLIILLLFLSLSGVLAYLGYEQANLRAEMANQGQQNDLMQATITQFRDQFAELRSQVAELPESADSDDSALRELVVRVQSGLTALEGQLDNMEALQQQVNSLATLPKSVASPQSFEWKILEANYLTQLASRKLQLESDEQTAMLLLRQADTALLESGSSTVLRARQAIAEDLALLQELQMFDREGVYLRIENLSGQVNVIDLLSSMRESFQSQRGEASTAVLAPAETQGFLDSSLDFLGKVFVWRRWEDSPQAILVPGQEVLILQRMHLILERAQLALMKSDTTLYQRSLTEAIGWLNQFAVIESSIGQALLAEFSALQEIDIAPELPEISRSANSVQQLVSDIR